jgi:hypothetical protein
MLEEARAAYGWEIATTGSIRARVQAALLDASFGVLAAGDLATLRKDAPEASALTPDLCARPLAGTFGDWDIRALRRKDGQDAEHWEALAKLATQAGQLGLAIACYDEAARFTTIYDYDPPRHYNSASFAAGARLEALHALTRTTPPLAELDDPSGEPTMLAFSADGTLIAGWNDALL